MKIRNKKTGEIVVFGDGIIDLTKIGCKNVAEMIEAGWEDYEEPKDFWFIDSGGEIRQTTYLTQCDKTRLTNFGNYFSSKEEAEKAVEKLKALKRLEDRGVVLHSFEGVESCENRYRITFSIRCDSYWSDRSHSVDADLNLLFGGGDD